MKRPTKAEQQLLDLILREVRAAKRRRQCQLSLMIEPFASSDGFYVMVVQDQPVVTYTCDGERRPHRR